MKSPTDEQTAMQVTLKPAEIVIYQIRINIHILNARIELQNHQNMMRYMGFECFEIYQIPNWSAYAGHLAFTARIMRGREVPHFEKLVAWDRKFEPRDKANRKGGS